MPSGLSNRKTKQIQRLLADGRSVADIAKYANLPLAEVEAFVSERRATSALLSATPAGRLVLIAGLLLTIVIAPMLISKKLYNVANLPQSAFVQAMAVLLLAAVLVYAAFQKERLRVSPLHLPLACLMVWSGVTFFWAINGYEFMYTWGHWLACAVIFYLAYQIMPDRRWHRVLLETVFWVGTVVALIGVMQHLLKIPWPPQIAAPSSTFANKNFAVHVVVPTLALGIAFFLKAQDSWRIWAYGLMTSLILTYLVYTGTRAGWVAAAVQVTAWGMFLLFQLRSVKSAWSMEKLVTLLVCGVLFLLLIHLSAKGFEPTLKREIQRVARELSLIEELDKKTENEAGVIQAEAVKYKPSSIVELPPVSNVDKSASFAGRIKVWTNTMYMIREHWLTGVGVGNFKIYFPLYDGRHDGIPMFDDQIQLSNTHNDYLQVWADIGTLGLLLAIWLGATICWLLIRLFRRETEHRFLVAGIGIAMLGMAVNALPSSPVQKAIPLLFLAVLLAVLAGFDRKHRAARQLALPRWVLAVAAALAILCTLAVWRLQVSRLAADHHYVYASAYSKQNMWEACGQSARRSLDHLPWRRKTYAYLAKSHLEQGEYDEAIRYFKESLTGYPNSPNTLFDLGVCYAKKGNRLLTETLQAPGDEADFSEAKGYLDQALEHYLRVGDLLPAYARLHNNIGALYMDHVRMTRYQIQQVSREPASEERQARLDDLNAQLDRQLQAALDEFRIEAGLNPANEMVVFNLGIACIQAQEYEEARDVLETVVRIKPEWALAHKNLGVLYFQHLNQRQKALEHFRLALEYDPAVEGAAGLRNLLKQDAAARP